MATVNQLFKIELQLVYYIGTYNYEVDSVKGISMRNIVDLTGLNYAYLNRKINKLRSSGYITDSETVKNVKYFTLSDKGLKVYKSVLNVLVELD